MVLLFTYGGNTNIKVAETSSRSADLCWWWHHLHEAGDVPEASQRAIRAQHVCGDHHPASEFHTKYRRSCNHRVPVEGGRGTVTLNKSNGGVISLCDGTCENPEGREHVLLRGHLSWPWHASMFPQISWGHCPVARLQLSRRKYLDALLSRYFRCRTCIEVVVMNF